MMTLLSSLKVTRTISLNAVYDVLLSAQLDHLPSVPLKKNVQTVFQSAHFDLLCNIPLTGRASTPDTCFWRKTSTTVSSSRAVFICWHFLNPILSSPHSPTTNPAYWNECVRGEIFVRNRYPNMSQIWYVPKRAFKALPDNMELPI